MEPADKPEKQSDRDVIYTLRTAHQTQTQLNLMADQKANIIVGAIIVVLSLLLTRFSMVEEFSLELYILLGLFVGAEITALILSIMVIRPRTRWKQLSQPIENMPNPLFFGFFTNYSEQAYVDHMMETVSNDRIARELLLRDLYQIGSILKRKFTLLRYAYFFAVSGLLVAVAGYLFVTLQ